MLTIFASLIAVTANAAPAGTAATTAPGDPASKAMGSRVSITQIDTSHYPTVRAAFGADEDGNGQTPQLTFTENGNRLTGVSVYRGDLGQYADRSHATVMLVLDTSLSMRGQRIHDAVAAAKQLIAHANDGDLIGLTTFGGDAKVVVKPTSDHDKVRRALDSVPVANRTTLFDGVQLAARTLASGNGSRRAIVLLTDGADTSSTATLDDAASAALKASIPIYAIAIASKANAGTPPDLDRLGNGTGGQAQAVDGTSQLTGLFAELGRQILQPYWIEYRSTAPNRALVELGITEGSGKPDAVRSFRAITNSSQPAGTTDPYVAPQKATQAKPFVPIPTGPLGLLLVAAPFGILLFWLSWSFLRRRTVPDVVARIDRYTRTMNDSGPRVGDARIPIVRRIAAPLLSVAESVLGHTAFFEKTRRRAEQAAIAVRPSELFGAMVSLGVLTGLLAFALAGPLAAGVALLLFGSLPNIWLIMKARKRRRRFEDQLPDVLQGIASSLNAGHSFNQAINAMIKDAPQPTSEEFQRVMTEARLGMPIEEALQHMAVRMGSDDFDFAVTTVNIQRTVGGSLAEILEMVSDTVRNRQQFR
ncbi:MAG: VWA domain-containing protein, partial [Gaiellales bacterium]